MCKSEIFIFLSGSSSYYISMTESPITIFHYIINSISNPKNNLSVFFFTATIIFCSRIPMILFFPGCGLDADAWRLVRAAQHISATGHYIVSRFPGYPIPELMYSLLWKQGYAVLNGITVLWSAISCAFFMLILRHYHAKNPVFAVAALALTPVFLLNSINCMDYLWGLAFILGSMYYILKNRPAIAGIMFGLSVGCRATSALMFIPLSMLLLDQKDTCRKQILIFLVTTMLVSIVCYIPCFVTYGLSFITFYKTRYPSWEIILGNITSDLWGSIGFIALYTVVIIATVHSVFFKSGKIVSIPATEKMHVHAWWLSILLYLLTFLRLPYEAEYLLPAVPFVILLLGRFLSIRLFQVVCCALMLSPFVSFLPYTRFSGPLFVEYVERVHQMSIAENLADRIRRLQKKSVIVMAEALPLFQTILFNEQKEYLKFEYSLKIDAVLNYQAQGYEVYFLPNARFSNYSLYKFDLVAAGAKAL